MSPGCLSVRARLNDSLTLVLIHGLGESGFCFEGLISDPRLASFGHLAADMPGYGKAPWPEDPLGLPDHAQCLADWLNTEESLADRDLVLVGHSMGGVIGTMLAEQLLQSGDQRLRGFVSIEGNISRADCGFSSRLAPYAADSPEAAQAMAKMIDEVYRDGQTDPALRVYYPSLCFADPRTYHRNSVELVELSEAEGLAARMAALDIPKTYILGNPRGTGQRSRELLDEAGIEWHAIDNAGHWPFLDQPKPFVDVLLGFLRSLS